MIFPDEKWREGSFKDADIDEFLIEKFFSYVMEKKMNLHSIIVVKNGYKILEAHAHPFCSSSKRDIYSVSKSFVSAAIGIAIDQGFISIESKIVTFFPEQVEPRISTIEKLTIKHLLTMTSGQKEENFMRIWDQNDWTKAYFQTPISYKPGSVHEYNNFNTFILSEIIQKVSGMRLIDFLNTYLFSKIGIERTCWSQPNGSVDFGASGFYASTDAMARFGHLILNNGYWKGSQLISEEYVKEATAKQIDSKQWKEPAWSSLNYGYGYHFWINKFGGYSARGMLGQEIIMNRKHNLVVALHGDKFSSEYELFDMIPDYILTACEKGYTAKNRNLKATICSFESNKENISDIPEQFRNCKKLYKLDNPVQFPGVFSFIETNLIAIGFEVIDHDLIILYHNNGSIYKFKCGLNGSYIVNSVISKVGGDEFDYRYALYGEFLRTDNLVIKIQPVSYAMQIIHEIHFYEPDKIEVKTYYYDREIEPLMTTGHVIYDLHD